MGLYTVKLFFSPVYIVYAISFLFFIFYFFVSGVVRIRVDVVLAVIGLFYILMVSNAADGSFVNLSLGLIGYIILTSTLYRLDSDYLYLNIIKASWLIAILLVADTIYRFANPMVPELSQLSFYEQSDSLFYLYKFNSFMFADSNTVGLLAMQTFFLVLGFSDFQRRKNKLLLVILFLMVLFSISRAAIIATIFCFVLIYFSRSRYLFYFAPLLAVGVGLAGALVYFYFSDDPSNQERFAIFSSAKDYIFYSANSTELFFGIGLSNSVEVIGQAAHNIFLTYLLELGIIGFFVFSVFFICVSCLSRDAFKYVVLPGFIAGLSYYMYAGTPFLFVPLAIMVEASLRKRWMTCAVN